MKLSLNSSNVVTNNIKNMRKNREKWASLIGEYQIRMEEGAKQARQNDEIIEEAKSESEEDSTSNKMSSYDDTSKEDYSLSELNDDINLNKSRPSKKSAFGLTTKEHRKSSLL